MGIVPTFSDDRVQVAKLKEERKGMGRDPGATGPLHPRRCTRYEAYRRVARSWGVLKSITGPLGTIRVGLTHSWPR